MVYKKKKQAFIYSHSPNRYHKMTLYTQQQLCEKTSHFDKVKTGNAADFLRPSI